MVDGANKNVDLFLLISIMFSSPRSRMAWYMTVQSVWKVNLFLYIWQLSLIFFPFWHLNLSCEKKHTHLVFGALSNWHYMFLPTKLQSQRSFLLPQPIPLKVSLCLLVRVPFFPVYSSSSPVFILLSTKLFSLFLSSSPSPHFIPLAFVTLSPALSWSFLDLLFRCHFSFTAALLWYFFFIGSCLFLHTVTHTHSPPFSLKTLKSEREYDFHKLHTKNLHRKIRCAWFHLK